MKPEDVARLYNSAKHPDDPYSMPEWALTSSNGQELLTRFASAIESHVRAETVAMCKENAEVRFNVALGEYIDWSAVDAAMEEHVNPMCKQPGCGRRKFEHYSIGNLEGLFCRKRSGVRFTAEAVDAAVKEGGGG